jgi:hypothetical protein
VRSFLHLHDAPLQAIIWAYLRRYYGLITDREAFAVLVFALETELKQFFRESEPWDMAFIDNFFKTNENRRLRVLMALNYGLIALEHRVVFIEWIGDWKNFMKLHTSQHGPLKWITDKIHLKKIKCPNLDTIQQNFECKICERRFPSYTQLKNHLHEKIFGNNETPTFRKTKDSEDEIIFIPIDIIKPPFEEVKTGLIYIDTGMPADANLFFIRDNQHFRNCAIFDDEKKSRDRFNVTEGKLISVGISQYHCVQFVYDNFETFIGLINEYKDYIAEGKKARIDRETNKRAKEGHTAAFQKREKDAVARKFNIHPKQKERYVTEQKELDEAIDKADHDIKLLKPKFIEKISEYNRSIKSARRGYLETFNAKIAPEQMAHYISRAQFLKKEIEIYRTKLKNETNAEKRGELMKTNKYVLSLDFVQFTLIVFAIFNSEFIEEQMEKMLKDAEIKVKHYSNQTAFDMPPKMHKPQYDKFVGSITDNMKNLSGLGLVFYRNHGGDISPIFTMLLYEWLSPLKEEIGFNPLGDGIIRDTVPHDDDFRAHAKTLTKKIEDEWKSMQAHYGGVQDINGAATHIQITDSTAYKWTPEMSGNELEDKEIEELKVYLIIQVFIVKADCANWKYLEALTDKIIGGIQVAAQIKQNPLDVIKKSMIKCIKRRFDLCNLIAEVEQDKEESVNIESSKIDFTPHDPTNRNFENEEQNICPEVHRDSLLIISSDDYTSMSSIFQRQGYLYQSNLLLHPVYSDHENPYLPARILHEKWWELHSTPVLSTLNTGAPFERPKIRVKIPGRGGLNRGLSDSLSRYYDEAGITTHLLQRSSARTYGDMQPITLFDLVSEQMISRSESVEDLLKSVQEKMISCIASKKIFSKEIAEQFGYYDEFAYTDLPKFEDVWVELDGHSTSAEIIQSINNSEDWGDFGHYKLILPFLASITRSSIEVYTADDHKNGKLHLSKVYNKTLDPYYVPDEDPTTIIKSVNITKEPIRLFMEKYVDEGEEKIWISHLFVEKYTTVTKTPDNNLIDVQRYLRGLKDKWNSHGTYSNEGISFEMSHCKYYLYLVHAHIIHIPQAVLKRLRENVSDKDARTLRSMEKLLLVGNMIEQDISQEQEDYENMLMYSNSELMEQCVQTLKTVKKRLLDQSKDGKIVNDDVGPALVQEQVDEEQTQSGFRSTQGKTQGKDGGYDPGPGGGGGGSGKKTFEVRHTTSEEEDYDDPDDDKSDDERDPNEDPADAEARRANRAENARLNALANGRPGAKVLHRRQNGKIVERDQNGNEHRTKGGTLCAEGQSMLKSPEYLLSGSALRKCNDPQNDLFTCAVLQAYVLDYSSRAGSKKKLFLRTDELLILVLHLVKRAMLNSHMGGFGDLHIPHSRETGAWDGILDRFRDNAVGVVKDPLGLADASSVELLMKTLSESGVECSAENEINQVLNPQHLELRQCLEHLREEVGWVVEARKIAPQRLDIPVTAAMLLQGFYPAFEQVSLHEEPDQEKGEDFRADHFLRDLFGGNPGPQRQSEGICFSRENTGESADDDTKLVSEMTPFWGEFFETIYQENQ